MTRHPGRWLAQTWFGEDDWLTVRVLGDDPCGLTREEAEERCGAASLRDGTWRVVEANAKTWLGNVRAAEHEEEQ